MSWYNVYDNVEVQRVTRKQAAAATAIVTVFGAAGLAAVVLGIDGPLPLWVGLGAAVAAWAALTVWMLRRYQRLRRIVWCIKFSDAEVVGYDYARRRITIPWVKVERLEIGGDSLTIVGPQPASLEITHLFAEFAQVSHCIMRYAERHGVPVFVDGRPWQQLDVYDLFPFLSEDASSPQRGSTAV